MTQGDPVVLALDVGGTSFKAALVDASGQPRMMADIPVAGAMGEAAFARMADFCGGLLQSGAARGLQPLAIGVVTPGMDEITGTVLFSSNLGWRDLPLRTRLEARFGLRVATGHDVRTAGLAESLLGAGRGEADFAYVMIGTGIAAAFVSNGQVVKGARSMGGEFGHIPVHPGGEPCPCGQLGCLETYASGAAIARRYLRLGGAAALTAREIAGVQATDRQAAQAWTEAVEALSLGLATITFMLDPAVIALGGGLAEAGPLLLDPLREALGHRFAWRTPPSLAPSRLGLAAGRIGAAILAWRLVAHPVDATGWRADDICVRYQV